MIHSNTPLSGASFIIDLACFLGGILFCWWKSLTFFLHSCGWNKFLKLKKTQANFVKFLFHQHQGDQTEKLQQTCYLNSLVGNKPTFSARLGRCKVYVQLLELPLTGFILSLFNSNSLT
mmetsp:Transcript_15117/g.16760  ORF Transcript_15117/g.16760 Transcript_15117/m.16760 type:complete len:119 (-) Transcript_15117:298-654(-)